MTKKPTGADDKVKAADGNGTPARAKAARIRDGRAPTAGPWDVPWHRKEDAAGWETTYRGAGRSRPGARPATVVRAGSVAPDGRAA